MCNAVRNLHAVWGSPRGCAAFLLLAAAMPGGLAGCTTGGYDTIQIGMTGPQCERMLGDGAFLRTDLGYCALREPVGGRTEATLVLLGRDGQVAGKLHAVLHRRWSGALSGYYLRGEIDPGRLGLSEAGPLDALRGVVHDLVASGGVDATRRASAWIAAGLVRLVERWPHAGSVASTDPELADMLRRVPGGGYAQVAVGQAGTYSFEYREGSVP